MELTFCAGCGNWVSGSSTTRPLFARSKPDQVRAKLSSHKGLLRIQFPCSGCTGDRGGAAKPNHISGFC